MPRPRKPHALKVLEGTNRPCRDYPEPEFPPADDTSPPPWLVGDDAVYEWRRLVALLESTRVLSEADLTALGHLCNLHGACLRLYRASLEPTAAQLTQLRLMLCEFGMTPASRSKAGGGIAKPKANPFEKLA